MEHNLTHILDALKQGVILLDDAGAVLYCNHPARAMLSLPDSPPWPGIEEIGELYPPGFWKQELKTVDVMITLGGQKIHFVASACRTGAGIVLTLDRERVQIEDEFRFFIMDNMSEGVALLDGQGTAMYLNSAAKVILGIGLHAGAARNWTVFNMGEFAPADFWQSPVYKKEVLFRKGDYEVHLLASAYHRSDKIILCLEEEKRETLRYIRQEALAATDLEAIAGIGPDLRKQAMVLANSDISFMITGESGTGKEVTARAVHYSSFRAKGPFVVIDCTALPEHLVESELFGYEPGSFTGAKSEGRAGKFEIADGGTIMLDEISELPLIMQPKLLRILNDQLVMRIGSRKPKAVNVRVIACTNRSLKEMVARGQFREDLYYRLKGAVLPLPPLRERMKYFGDLTALFLKKYGHGKDYRFSAEAQAVMSNYQWPGNVRELEKAVQYALAQNPEEVIDSGQLPGDIIHGEMELRARKLKEMVRLHERMLVNNALQANRYVIKTTAIKLGLTRRRLAKKIKALGIVLPSQTIPRFPKRMGRGNKASIEVLEISPLEVGMRDKIHIRLKVTNTGRSPWLQVCKTRRLTAKHSGWYTIFVSWVNVINQTQEDMVNVPLPVPVHPGETIIIDDYIHPIQYKGRFYVLIHMGLVGVGSFREKPISSQQDVIASPDAEITIR